MFRLAVIASMFAAAIAANVHDRAYYEEKFINWMKEHNVKAENGERFVQWLQNFANNDDIIESHNAKKASYTLGHNKFSHMSNEEFKVYMNLKKMERPADMEPAAFIHTASNTSATADSIDWVSKGAVTGVKDQGSCGSCWSFSTTGALEGAYQIKNGNLKSFSEQNLVDCDNRQGNPRGTDMGCNGGLMDSAFSWTQKNGGLCSEADYPYVSGQTRTAGTCAQSSCTLDSKVAPKSYTDVQKNSDSAMMSALNKGPVSIAIEADQSAFQLYKSGVFTEACGDNLDHGVLAVGYGSQDGQDYYKVKNSWGTSWGMDGYILLERGGSQKTGQCGMLSGPPSYPNL
jgi:C1A family cysteine protease